MCFTVQLSMFFAVSDSFDILSCCFDFVKNFFNFFSRSFFVLFRLCRMQLWYHTTSSFRCQQLFKICFSSNGEGGIWTLARRKPSIPLAGAPLQPLEYFSNLPDSCSFVMSKIDYTKGFHVCQLYFNQFSIFFDFHIFSCILRVLCLSVSETPWKNGSGNRIPDRRLYPEFYILNTSADFSPFSLFPIEYSL